MEERNDITGSLLSYDKLKRIKESGKGIVGSDSIDTIRELLNEPFLQKAIIKVMESDDREKTLMELKSNSEMSILIDELLICVGAARRREDGSIEFIGV